MGAYEDTLQRIAAGATPWKLAVRVVAASNITLAGLQTIDGVALAEGDRVLCAGQTAAETNGVYVAAAAAWVRAVDMASATYLKIATTIAIAEGTVYGRQTWGLTSPTNGDVRVGVTALVFSLATPSPLLAAPSGTAQTLPDADTTLTSARRAVRTAALTANRADTLPDGTTVGERRTVERTLASASGNIFKNRVMNSDGSVAAWLNGPGQPELAWDGTKWSPVAVDIRERVFTPYDFGGRGDGSYDDTTALAAWAASASLSGASCRLHLPEGIWRTTAPIVVQAPTDNTHSVRITGHNGMSRGRADGSVILYIGSATASPIFKTLGLAGSHISDIVFDCASLCDGPNCGVDATYTSCSGVTWARISVYYPRDIASASCFSVGNASVAGSQADTIGWDDCLFVAQESLVPSTNVDCWRANIASNTKNFAFRNCSFIGGRRGINWEFASGTLEYDGNGSIGACGVDFYQAGGLLKILRAQSERSGRALTLVGADAVAEISSWEWHGGRHCSDDYPFHITSGQVRVTGSRFENFRGRRQITSITPGTEFIVFNADEYGFGLDTTNEEVEIRSLGTYPTYVNAGGRTVTYAPGTKLYIRDYDDSADPVISCKVSLSAGGAVVDWVTAGSGALWFVSPTKIRATGTEQLASSVSGSFTSSENFWDSNGDGNGRGTLSISDGTNDLLSPTYSTGTANGIPTMVSSTNDRGGHPSAPERLACKDNRIFDRPIIALDRSVLDSPYDRVGTQHFSGAPGTAWHVERFNYAELYKNATTIDVYRRMPPRATIKRAIVEIVQQFANAAGNVTLNLYEATAFATILVASNLEAAAGTVYGELAADHGTAWKAAIGVRPAVAWSASWSVLLNLVTTGGNWGNGTVTNLTAGEFVIYLEYEVPPRAGS